MLPLVVGSSVPQSLHDLSKIEETNKTFFLLSHLMTSPRDHKDLDLLHADAQLRCAHEDQLCLGAQGPHVAAGYHDDNYHYTLPCVGGPTDRQAAAQPCLRLTAAAGRAATLQPPSRLVAHPSREFRLLPAVLAHESVTGRMAQVETIGSSRRW